MLCSLARDYSDHTNLLFTRIPNIFKYEDLSKCRNDNHCIVGHFLKIYLFQRKSMGGGDRGRRERERMSSRLHTECRARPGVPSRDAEIQN